MLMMKNHINYYIICNKTEQRERKTMHYGKTNGKKKEIKKNSKHLGIHRF